MHTIKVWHNLGQDPEKFSDLESKLVRALRRIPKLNMQSEGDVLVVSQAAHIAHGKILAEVELGALTQVDEHDRMNISSDIGWALVNHFHAPVFVRVSKCLTESELNP